MANPYAKYVEQSNPYAQFAQQEQPKPTPVKIGAEGFQDHLKAELASRPVWERALAGAGTFVDDAALRLKQLVTGGLSPEDVQQARANRTIKADPAGFAGNVAGGVGALGPIGISSIGGNAALGAGVGGLGTPVLEGESGLANAALGGVAGGVGALAGKLLTGSPLVKPTEATKRLMREGVVPTVGQNAASSQSGVAQALGRAEEKAASLPVVGDFITGARRRALGEFNKAAIQKAMPGGKVSQIGRDGVEEALEATGRAFDDVYRGAAVSPSDGLTQALVAAKDKPAIGLSEQAAQKYDRIIDRLVTQRLKPDMDASLVKKTIESDLGKEARNLKFSTNSDDKALGEALMAARDAIRDVMNRAVGPEKAGRLASLNKSYAAGKTLEKAADRASAQGGVFTPYQLQRAAKDGVLRPLADDAQAVLASRVPNSGTADRALQALLASGQFPDRGTLGYLGGGLLTMPFYSRAGSRFLLGDLTPEAVQAAAPFIAQGGRGILYGQ
jgi:hypothetical protein